MAKVVAEVRIAALDRRGVAANHVEPANIGPRPSRALQQEVEGLIGNAPRRGPASDAGHSLLGADSGQLLSLPQRRRAVADANPHRGNEHLHSPVALVPAEGR